jgi:hypothetical protein
MGGSRTLSRDAINATNAKPSSICDAEMLTIIAAEEAKVSHVAASRSAGLFFIYSRWAITRRINRLWTL